MFKQCVKDRLRNRSGSEKISFLWSCKKCHRVKISTFDFTAGFGNAIWMFLYTRASKMERWG